MAKLAPIHYDPHYKEPQKGPLIFSDTHICHLAHLMPSHATERNWLVPGPSKLAPGTVHPCSFNWVVVSELNVSYHNVDIL